MAPVTLGIDLGTSSVKAVVATLDGTVAGQAVGGYRVSSPRPGHSESEPAEWLAATAATVKAAVTEAGVEPEAIGLSGQMHGVVPTGEDGRAVHAAMLWSDARATQELSHYTRLPPAVRARLANPLSPGMAGPLLAWLAANEPAAWAATRWALQPKDWLRARLTGRFATEPSDASATLLYDIAADRWDTEVVAALGLDEANLPPILARSGDRAGSLTEAGARLLGLRPGLPVAAGAADTAAAALGSGLVEPGTMQLTIGTGAQLIRPVATLPDPLPERPVTHLYRAATDTGWYAMGAVLNGGLTLDWVRRILGASWPELYAAAAVPPRTDDPLFLPHLHGERTPYLDPGMRGAWTRLDPRHDRRDLLRAALEGVAFAVREALDALLQPGEAIDHLRLAGGGTKDPAWRQMLADILGRPLAPVEVAAASGLGAANLGARAAGLPTRRTRPRDDLAAATVLPAAHGDLYCERRQAFHRTLRSLRDIDATSIGSHKRVTPGHSS
ncbi:MAG TPA: FGGY family carbohydrate kinase [Actinoplanes sp.]|jgi:xylulokinase|nr:FGGY family carbohydrate kinase [Actinoplanes sp.]